MGGEGAQVEDVILVLKNCRVFVALTDEVKCTYTIEKGDFLECHVLKGEIVSKLLHHFKRKLNIPIHFFWNPEASKEYKETDSD